MLLRISVSILSLLAILFAPFYVSVILIISIMFYFSKYYEGVFLFLLSDLLYGVKNLQNHPPIFISFFSSIVVLIIIEILKKKLKFYPHND